MKIVLSIIIIYISFKPNNLRELIKMLVFFYLTSFIFGGAALAVIYMVNSGKISIQRGVIIGNYTLITIFAGVIIAFLVLISSFKIVKARISRNDLFCKIKIKIDKGEVKIKAMIDTGNFLKEPITNIPVVIVEHNLLKGLISNEILDNIEKILGGDLDNLSIETKNKYIPKLKLIPFSSIGKSNGMLLGIKADNIEIEEESKIKIIDKVIIGLYNKKISKRGDYSALIGIDML